MPTKNVDHAKRLAAAMNAECLGMRVLRLQRLVSRHFSQALRPHGLTAPQMEVLGVLALHETPIKPAALADELAIERSTMSRNLALMQEFGWIATSETSASGRAMAVVITPAGKKKLTSAGAGWAEAQATVRSLLGANARKTLDTWLGGLAEGLMVTGHD